MNINKLKMAMIMGAMGASFIANAAVVNQGSGKVTFTGSIIDAPCSIAADSADQTIELGQVSQVSLKDGGKSTVKPFYINLENCELTTSGPGKNNAVNLTFTGASGKDQDGRLSITGTAKGASIAITDGTGEVIKLGTATNAQTLQSGKNTLSFSAYLQGDGASSATPGDFSAVTDFTLAYQ
ncbi:MULTISPECIES: fimbrial protein [Serratia]|jgi:type 1 fimbria pilin|uniref:Type 1 fimbrial protein n=1 Tax=Serratia liquefaciens TaxID=614 RepID=A0A515D4G3_SERLI|nr:MULTISPECIES: fimbrial protein [Serratia]MBI6163061.1 type 1 fimbrial protein [Serratia liquefaciens]MBV0843395.1 type 1 fimbrial protein [Serratia liquefaciens]MCS4318633.1 type 1 fimbria pilin [Serratia sp. BIGb0234]QDL35290.1 type 1 fimbrial protein [Serratia liquefaciens]RYM76005.1 fimbria A protein [Serratia liquefaciens]